jgi:hypothetical protein
VGKFPGLAFKPLERGWYAACGMQPGALEMIARISARDQRLIASSRGVTMDESPDKVRALADVDRALDRLGAACAVGGGVAGGIRSGVPRATLDTDVAVRSTVERDRVIEAFIPDPDEGW